MTTAAGHAAPGTPSSKNSPTPGPAVDTPELAPTAARAEARYWFDAGVLPEAARLAGVAPIPRPSQRFAGSPAAQHQPPSPRNRAANLADIVRAQHESPTSRPPRPQDAGATRSARLGGRGVGLPAAAPLSMFRPCRQARVRGWAVGVPQASQRWLGRGMGRRRRAGGRAAAGVNQ